MKNAEIAKIHWAPTLSITSPSNTGIINPPKFDPVEANPITFPIDPGGVMERSKMSREGIKDPIKNRASANKIISSNSDRLIQPKIATRNADGKSVNDAVNVRAPNLSAIQPPHKIENLG